MKRFMTTAATALILSTGAYAETHSQNTFSDYSVDQAVELYASDLLGARIYATENEVGDTYEAGAEQEWDDLGEINDMVMNADGSVQVVILGVGGFLGVGERDVAIQMSDLKIVRDGEDPTDYFLVINANKEQIENAPEFQRAEEQMEEAAAEGEQLMENAEAETEEAMADTAAAVGSAAATVEAESEEAMAEVEAETEETMVEGEQAMENAEAEVEETAAEAEAAVEGAAAEAEAEVDEAAAETEMAAENMEAEAEETMAEGEQAMDNAEREMLTAPEVEREGYAAVSVNDLSAEDIEGTAVYGPNDENVGEIGELLLSEDGSTIEKAVINVGGFLGLGEKPVAVTFDELQLLRSEDGSELRIYIDSSEESLEALPEYEG